MIDYGFVIEDGVLRNNLNTEQRKLISGFENYIIPENVVKIGTKAFKDCVLLTHIDIPDSVTEIGEMAFSGCISLSTIKLPLNLGSMPTHFETELENSIPLYSGYVDHGWKSNSSPSDSYYLDEEIYNSNLETYKHTPFGMFQGCDKLTSIDIPCKVKIIDVCCFADCKSLREVVLHEGLEKIRDYAFAQCWELNRINIPDTVKIIEQFAFEGCVSLSEVIIPHTVVTIEEGAFSNCGDNLILVVEKGSVAEKYAIDNNLKFKHNEYIQNYCTDEISFDYYILDESNVKIIRWHKPTDIIYIPQKINDKYKIHSIGVGAFRNINSLKKVVVPDSVESISSEAFYCIDETEYVYGDLYDLGWSNLKQLQTNCQIWLPANVVIKDVDAFYRITMYSDRRHHHTDKNENKLVICVPNSSKCMQEFISKNWCISKTEDNYSALVVNEQLEFCIPWYGTMKLTNSWCIMNEVELN